MNIALGTVAVGLAWTLEFVLLDKLLQKKQYAHTGDPQIDLLNQLKQEFGNGIASQIFIINTSGLPLIFKQMWNMRGHVWKYPLEAEVSFTKPATFLHTGAWFAGGSKAWITYQIGDTNNYVHIGWSNRSFRKNKIKIEITESLECPSSIEKRPKNTLHDYYKAEKTITIGIDEVKLQCVGQVGHNSSPLFRVIFSAANEKVY